MDPANDPLDTSFSTDESVLIALCQKVIREPGPMTQLLALMKSQDDDQWDSLYISMIDLSSVNELLRQKAISDPQLILDHLHDAAQDVQDRILQLYPHSHPRQKIRIRLRGGVTVPAGHMPHMTDVGRFVSVKGTVVRACTPTMLEYRKVYTCTKCGGQFIQNADMSSVLCQIPIPVICGAPSPIPCAGKLFTPNEAKKDTKDYQELKIQEQIHTTGTMPRSIFVVVEDDLVDVCKAGDDITVSGVVARRWNSLIYSERANSEIIIRASSITINNTQKFGNNVTAEDAAKFEKFWEDHGDKPLTGRNEILKHICPETFGMMTIKLALALVLAGGVPKVAANGTRVRGESHMLLVGDPGTGKSKLLRAAAQIANRAVLTTGVGTSGAGLTVTAVKDKGGAWGLEAGALVLADGGVCLIDEFNTIKEHDRTTIHEAMEQQTLSVAKAGLVAKLQTRCSVIGATNPKGKYDPGVSVSLNIAVETPLLSRFDLVMVMLDECNEGWDVKVSKYILDSHSSEKKHVDKDVGAVQENVFWDTKRLRTYFSYIKATKVPEHINDEAKAIIQAYFLKQRSSDMADAARTTVRMLDSLLRLAQAHARLMNRPYVEMIDAIMTVYLMEASMASSTVLGAISTVRSTFSDDPDAEYWKLETKILRALKLDKMVRWWDPDESVDPSPRVPDRPQFVTADNYEPTQHSAYSQIQRNMQQAQNVPGADEIPALHDTVNFEPSLDAFRESIDDEDTNDARLDPLAQPAELAPKDSPIDDGNDEDRRRKKQKLTETTSALVGEPREPAKHPRPPPRAAPEEEEEENWDTWD